MGMLWMLGVGRRRKQHEAIGVEVGKGSPSEESCGGGVRRKQQEAIEVEVGKDRKSRI